MLDADEGAEGDIMAGDRRLARADSALPDSIIPDASYRPVPIVWFAAAFLIQMAVLIVLFLVLLSRPGWITILMASLASLAIAAWTWERGMKDAGTGWRVATVMMLVIQWALVCLGAAARA